MTIPVIKFFTNHVADSLEERINEWISELPLGTRIISMQTSIAVDSENVPWYLCTILYIPGEIKVKEEGR